jgi:hypothetical protein
MIIFLYDFDNFDNFYSCDFQPNISAMVIGRVWAFLVEQKPIGKVDPNHMPTGLFGCQLAHENCQVSQVF